MAYQHNMAMVTYHDLEGHPAGKLAMHEVDGRFYLYTSSVWHSGWSVLDVTDPSAPELTWVPGPANTATQQIQVADGFMVSGQLPFPPGWGGDPAGPEPEVGLTIWSLEKPTEPVKLGYWKSAPAGMHRSFYSGGRYVHASANMPGYVGEIYVVIDIDDPTKPQTVGTWAWPGQHAAAGQVLSEADQEKGRTGRPFDGLGTIWLHGGPYVEGNRAYCGWARAGMVVLDISDVTQPRLAGKLSFYPPLGSSLAAHTVVPLPDRQLAIVNSEALQERCQEPLNFAAVVDIRDEADPMVISLFPLPEPPPGYDRGDFTERSGRFGPHNQHQPQSQTCLRPSDNLIFLTYRNAGLQVFDISQPRRPRIVAYFIPDEPRTKVDPRPHELALDVLDVLVDRRGFIYISDWNDGVHVLRLTCDTP